MHTIKEEIRASCTAGGWHVWSGEKGEGGFAQAARGSQASCTMLVWGGGRVHARLPSQLGTRGGGEAVHTLSDPQVYGLHLVQPPDDSLHGMWATGAQKLDSPLIQYKHMHKYIYAFSTPNFSHWKPYSKPLGAKLFGKHAIS